MNLPYCAVGAFHYFSENFFLNSPSWHPFLASFFQN